MAKRDIIIKADGLRDPMLVRRVDRSWVSEGVLKEIVGKVKDGLGGLAEFGWSLG